MEWANFPLVGSLSDEPEEGDRNGCMHGAACMYVCVKLACILHDHFSWILTHSNVLSKQDFPSFLIGKIGFDFFLSTLCLST